LEGREQIKEIEKIKFINAELLSKIKKAKCSIPGIICVDGNGNRYIVEMQNKVIDKKDFSKRIEYYATNFYSSQLNRG
jgi:predicted transposase/invertase (TIGR01784 family)